MIKSIIAVASTIIALLAMLTWTPCSVYAEEFEEDIVGGKEELTVVKKQKSGVFIAAGPMIGFDMDNITSPGGGPDVQIGYQINDMFSVLLQSGFYYTRSRDVNYFLIPVLPTLKVLFDTNFFLYGGGGYSYLYTSRGRTFNHTAISKAAGHNGWTVYGGGGYQIWWREKIAVSPEVGLDYTRIASSNMIIPIARINALFLF